MYFIYCIQGTPGIDGVTGQVGENGVQVSSMPALALVFFYFPMID